MGAEFLLTFPIWQNQYNLFDSHDIGRFHIYPGMNEEKYRGAVISMFTLIGVPSIYYGDEASIGGMVGFFEGGRYPMPWGSGYEDSQIYLLYKKLAHLRHEHPVFAEGSFRFLCAENQVVAFARFDEKETFVTVLSSSEKPQEILLPLTILGVTADRMKKDVLERELEMEITKEGNLKMTVMPEGAYLLKI